MDDAGLPPPGWYPVGQGWECWWDGAAWTDHRRPAGTPTPPPAPPVAQPSTGWPSIAASEPPSYGVIGTPGPPASGSHQPHSSGAATNRTGRVWLWITVAAVLALVVGAGAITLAVTQPWSDDEPAAGPDGPDAPALVAGDAGDPAARSDFDGDGLGDLAGVFYDGAELTLTTLTSTDDAFEVSQEESPRGSLIWDDWDGDGTATILSWEIDYDDQFVIEGVSGDFSAGEWSSIELWEEVSYRVRVETGDFDGDGLPDIAVLGQTQPLEVGVWVLRGTGDAFEAPELWHTAENATYGSTRLFPGDFDGDGTDDLLFLRPQEGVKIAAEDRRSGVFDGEHGVQLLLSTTDGFEPEGDSPGTTPFGSDAWFPRDHVVGDFRGDGTVLVGIQDPTYRSDDIYFFSYVDGNLERAELKVQPSGRGRGMTAVDVDGDGRDDLVIGVPNADDLSSATALRLEVAVFDGSEEVETASWSELPCEESCLMTFDAPSGI